MERPELAEFRERVCTLHRQDDLEAGMVAILEAFAPFGVRPFVLKGPVLARLLYTADEHRGYIDIDLLVAPHDMPRARQALSGMGCLNALELRGIRDVAGSLHSDTWLLRKEFSDGPGAMMIDLHWRLPGCEAPPEVAWKALAARRTTLEIRGREVAVLDRGGLALHLATHAASHGPVGLKAMGDLARGIERWPLETWQSAARLAGEVDATCAMAAGLRLTPAGVVLADALALPDGEQLTGIRDRAARPRGAFHLDALSQARTAREHVVAIRHALLPPPAWIRWEDSRAARSRTQLVRGYARHLRRAPRWAFRAWHSRRRASDAPSAGS